MQSINENSKTTFDESDIYISTESLINSMSNIDSQQFAMEKASYYLGMAGGSALVNILNAVIVTAALWDQFSKHRPLSWFIVLFLVNMVVIIIGYFYQRAKNKKTITYESILNKRRLFFVFKVLGAVVLASSLYVIWPENNALMQILIIFMVGGAMIGAVTTLSSDLMLFYGYIIPLAIGTIFKFFIIGSSISYLMSIMATLYVIFVIYSATSNNYLIRETILSKYTLRRRQMEVSALNKGMNTVFSDINQTSHTIASSTEHASERLKTVDGMIDSIHQSVSDISSKSIDVNNSTKEINFSIAEVINKSQENTGILEQSVKAMQTLEESSKEIDKIVDVVNEIALNTKILSINAAIEAARAGTYGSGFGIVAESVRALSQRTTISLESIKKLISNNSLKIVQSKNLIDTTANHFNKIVDNVKVVSENMNRISSIIEKHSVELSSMDNNLISVKKMTFENSNFVKTISQTSAELKSKTNIIVSSFKK
ncbi:MAG: hypothetical protein HQK53_04020 [Oligoflexia bacterium]|nr:hypothetical protein [Oligoflexia bacterium]